MFYLQVLRYEVHAARSHENQAHTLRVAPPRGLIYDRNGVVLADNVPTSALVLVPEQIDDLEQTLDGLADQLLLTDAEVTAFRRRLARSRPFEPVPLRLRLSEADIAKIAVDSHTLPGVEISSSLVRRYPQGEVTVHAVGSVRRISAPDLRRLDPDAYAGTNYIGKLGVERYYEKRLLGAAGYRHVETNVSGRIMQQLRAEAPQPGEDLHLHLDLNLQRVVNRLLDNRRGALVALDPATGGVLALTSSPSYDPNLFIAGVDTKTIRSLQESPDSPFFNRALRGQYEPGSTIKPFVGLIGLATNRITENFTIEDPGYFKLPGDPRLYRDWNWDRKTRQGGHGEVNLQKAIYRSCNVFFYSLALDIGIDTLGQHLAQFGFGRSFAMDIPEAHPGLLPSRQWKQLTRGEVWYPGDTVNIGIGQGDLLVTPLQMAVAVSILANRGRVVQPRMSLDQTNDGLPYDRVRLGDTWMWNSIVEAMEMVVHRGGRAYGDNGTAWAYIGQDAPYRLAGKSGTAQVVSVGQDEGIGDEVSSGEGRPEEHAWFIAFAPVERPRIAIAVVVENGGGGSSVAGPIARAAMDAYLLDTGLERLAAGR